jgi:hypothetical protein
MPDYTGLVYRKKHRIVPDYEKLPGSLTLAQTQHNICTTTRKAMPQVID